MFKKLKLSFFLLLLQLTRHATVLVRSPHPGVFSIFTGLKYNDSFTTEPLWTS